MISEVAGKCQFKGPDRVSGALQLGLCCCLSATAARDGSVVNRSRRATPDRDGVARDGGTLG
jgi:hypothetical protein